uniref:hypothetical protein n=1 Tax=Cupriavidus yeoncheonensis TaxID=1462994 RepID=UPI003F4998AC
MGFVLGQALLEVGDLLLGRVACDRFLLQRLAYVAVRVSLLRQGRLDALRLPAQMLGVAVRGGQILRVPAFLCRLLGARRIDRRPRCRVPSGTWGLTRRARCGACRDRRAREDVAAVSAQLAAAQRRAERAEAEAALARQLLAELRVAPRERTGGQRKAGGQASTAIEEKDAPTRPLKPDDGNDGN